MALLLAAAGLFSTASALAARGSVVVRAHTVATSLKAFARVEPVAVVRLQAAQTGIVAGFQVLPGQKLRAGATIGHLQGPAAAALLAEEQATVAGARAEQAAADKILSVEKAKQAARLSTRQAVYRAEAALAGAQARLDAARARLRATRAALVLRAPASGRVLEVETADGARVEPGQTLLTLQPAGSLWLRAEFYGSEATAVRIGMRGRFLPAAGGAAVAVRVRALPAASGPDGGQPVGLEPVGPPPAWRNGEAGSLLLDAGERTLVAVPTRALILDAGRWWVLVRTARANRPRQVVPGPARGEDDADREGTCRRRARSWSKTPISNFTGTSPATTSRRIERHDESGIGETSFCRPLSGGWSTAPSSPAASTPCCTSPWKCCRGSISRRSASSPICPARTAGELETLVARPLEGEILGLPQLVSVRSTMGHGTVEIDIRFAQGNRSAAGPAGGQQRHRPRPRQTPRRGPSLCRNHGQRHQRGRRLHLADSRRRRADGGPAGGAHRGGAGAARPAGGAAGRGLRQRRRGALGAAAPGGPAPLRGAGHGHGPRPSRNRCCSAPAAI